QERSVWEPIALQGQTARRPNAAHTWDLLQAVNQIREENPLGRLCLEIFGPRKRNLHRHDLTCVINAEPRIEFEHLDQTAPEQSRSDDEDKSDGDLYRHDYSANALAAMSTRLAAPTIPEAPAQIPGCRPHGGEHSESCGNRAGKQQREYQYGSVDGNAVQPRE